MNHKKCQGFIYTDPVYQSEPHVHASCLKCGQSWDLEVANTGPAGVMARFLKKKMTTVSNGR